MPLISGGGPVRAVSVDASKPAFFEPQSLAFHSPAGAKNPTERNIAVRLFEITNPAGKKRIVSRVAAHPRFKHLQAGWAKRGFAISAEDPLPSGAAEVARVSKGDLLRLPLTRDGNVASEASATYRHVWAVVTALKSSGSIRVRPCEFVLSEIKKDAGGAIDVPDSRLFGLKVKDDYTFQNASLLEVVRNTPSETA